MSEEYGRKIGAAGNGGARRLKLLATFSVLAVAMAMVMAVGLFSVCDDSDATDASGVTVDGKEYESISVALQYVDNGTVKLNGDIADSFSIAEGKTIVLDLNGKTCTVDKTVSVYGKLTVIDSSVKAEPKYQGGTVVYESGMIKSDGIILQAMNGGVVKINSGKLVSGYVAVWAVGNISGSDAEPYNSSVVMNGGFVEAQEFSLGVQGVGSKLVVNGGICHSKDNAVLGGNGTNNKTKYCGGTEMEINGGFFIGDIKTSEYVACGIYHPQAGQLTVNGGTFVINGGVGILMRGGSLTMNGGTVTTTGNTTGKVGDSRVVVTCSSVFIDLDAKYYDNANISVKVNGGKFNSDLNALSGCDGTTGYSSRYSVTGGSFCTSVDDFVADGYKQTKVESYYEVGKPYEGKTIETDAEEISVVDVETNVEVSVGGTTKTSVAICSTSDMGSVSLNVNRDVAQSTATPNAQLKMTLDVGNTVSKYMDITVSMSIPSGYKPVVNYLMDDGSVESMEILGYGADYVTFRTYHNSVYEFGLIEYHSPVIYDDDDDDYSADPVTPSSTSSKSSDNATAVVACAAAAVAAALAVAFFLVDSRRP